MEQAISSSLNLFYKSGTYNILKSFSQYRNELEVYTEENDYYLYGIIDNASAFKLMFLLTIFFGPPPLTLWFITMIMLLYLILQPLLLFAKL